MEVEGRRLQVRVRQTRERTLPGWIVGLLGGLGLIACVYSSGDLRYLHVGLALATWGAGPMLAWRPRARLAVPVRAKEGLRVGSLLVPWGAAAQIARARRGASVAMSWGKGTGAFFEVASMADAHALVHMAMADESRPVDLRLRSDTLRAVTTALGLIAMSFGLGYAVAVGLLGDTDYKGTFGLPGLLFAIVASFFYLIAQLLRRTVVVSGPGSEEGAWGAIGRHLALHVRVLGAGVRAENRGDDENDGTPPRVRIMLRDGEPTRAWLARIDGAASGGEGYRGLSPSREDLSAVLADDAARPDLRLAAARVLIRQHGESLTTVSAGLDDQLRERCSLMAMDDLDHAAEELDRQGPMFRALKG